MSLDMSKNDHNEEEYHSSETEGLESDVSYDHSEDDLTDYESEADGTEEGEGEGLAKDKILMSVKTFVSNNKKVVFIGGLVLLSLVTLHLGKAHKNKELMQSKEAAVQQQNQVTQKKQSEIVTKTTDQVNQLSSELSAVTQKESARSADVDRLSDRVDNMQHVITSIRSDQLKSQQAQKSLELQMHQLTAGMNQWAKAHQSDSSAKNSQSSSASHQKQPVSVPVVYYTKAVVPGRAWVENNFGHSTSIAVGDSLKGYGVVKAINADKGMILMSSGKVIQYGDQDQ